MPPHSLIMLPIVHLELIAISDRLCVMTTTHQPVTGPSDSAAAKDGEGPKERWVHQALNAVVCREGGSSSLLLRKPGI